MLTEEMTRLCGEIVALREMRGNLITQLQSEAKGRKQAVTQHCSDLRSSLRTTAKRAEQERAAFLNNLKRSVGAQRRELRSDLAGARQAWAGKTT